VGDADKYRWRRTVASWIARPGRYADCAIAIAENLARGNARNNIELAFAVIAKEIVKTMVGILVHGNNHYILKPKLCRASLVAGEFVYIEEVLSVLIYGEHLRSSAMNGLRRSTYADDFEKLRTQNKGHR